MAALHMYLNFHASVSENTVEFRLPRHELVCMTVKVRVKFLKFSINLRFRRSRGCTCAGCACLVSGKTVILRGEES